MPTSPAVIPVAVYGIGVDHLPDDVEDPADIAAARIDADRLHRLLAALPARERKVVCRHYGIGCHPRTLREVAGDRDLRVSVSIVHKLEQRALRRLRERF
jgi:RNA polymerase sigma factor (sigma-70 family)